MIAAPRLADALAKVCAIVGGADQSLLTALAINRLGLPRAVTYAPGDSLALEDWVFLPQYDAIGFVVSEETVAGKRFAIVDHWAPYPSRNTWDRPLRLPIGSQPPRPVSIKAHARAAGFCRPGICRSSALEELVGDLADLLVQAGFVEVDGIWIGDDQESLLGAVRLASTRSRSGFETALRREIAIAAQRVGPSAARVARSILDSCGLTYVVDVAGSVALAGDWILTTDGDYAFIDSVPQLGGARLTYSGLIVPFLDASQAEPRRIQFNRERDGHRGVDSSGETLAASGRDFQRFVDIIAKVLAPETTVIAAAPQDTLIAPTGGGFDVGVEVRPPPAAQIGMRAEEAAVLFPRARELSLLKTTFLLDFGWSYRLKVIWDVIYGTTDPVVPLALCAYLGIRKNDKRTFLPAQNGMPPLDVHNGPPLRWMTPLEVGLQSLDAEPGDAAFVAFNQGRYRITLARYSEKPDDELGELLWLCGLDPNNRDLRRNPWPRLARVLGGEGVHREDVRVLLERRRDWERLELLELAEADRRDPSVQWPEDWWALGPLAGSAEFYAIAGRDHMRLAVAFGPTAASAPQLMLVSSPNGVLWMEVEGNATVEDCRAAFNRLPISIVPTNASWARWARAEHVARQASRCGRTAWRFTFDGSGWLDPGGSRHPGLLEALESLSSTATDCSAGPARPPTLPQPAPSRAFHRLVSAACTGGLSVLSADIDQGFEASYASGTIAGPTLSDVLRGPGLPAEAREHTL